uniref:Serpentine Receptor, class I n=2 Tax=Caenorhabditis japonica TaxID=281687 RepID=A0A8R1I7E7_CAEJA
MDFHLTVLMQFVPLFPVFGGYCTGLLTQTFHVDDFFQATATAFCICLMASALNSCFVRKHQAIAKINHKLLLNNVPYAIVLFLLNLFPFVASGFLYLSMLSKPDQVKLIDEVYPNLVTKFQALPNYVVFDSNFWAIVTFTFIFFGCAYTVLLVGFTTYHMFQILEENRKHISVANYAKHRATLRSLLAQFATCSLIIGPATIFSILVVTRYSHSQVATHWIIVALTLHSSANSLVMILTYPPYHHPSLPPLIDRRKIRTSPKYKLRDATLPR